MMYVHKIIATSLGIGYIGRGGGTVAAICVCLFWYVLGVIQTPYPGILLSLTLLFVIAGTWSAGKVEPLWGKDDKKVVIDEVAGMCISLLFLPVTWEFVLAALVLFRFFDIAKPLYIRRMERLPGGWGVMMDDILAGVYANLVLQLVIYLKR